MLLEGLLLLRLLLHLLFALNLPAVTIHQGFAQKVLCDVVSPSPSGRGLGKGPATRMKTLIQ
jgi:hypothetical protein